MGSIILSGAASAVAVNSQIYVSTNGNNSWNGLSATYNNTSGSGPKNTIPNAINTVAVNGTIHIEPGTYKENNITIYKNMNIIGGSPANTIINGTNKNTIFTIYPGVNVTISNLTLTLGKNSFGGAIVNMGKLTLVNSILNHNTATTMGGAVWNDGTMSMSNSTLSYNTANGDGGAILNSAKLTILTSTLSHNTVTINNGGGAVFNYGTLTITSSALTNNNATYGGAILNSNITSIEYCQIIGNTASLGSAICSFNETVNAKYNWWGSNSNPTNKMYGNVNVSPWLTNPLTVTSISPINKAVNIPINTTIKIIFNEPIKAGSNWIVLTTSNGTPIPFTTTITGYTLTITFKKLTNNTKYYLTLHTGSLKDLNGNPSALYTSTFTTI